MSSLLYTPNAPNGHPILQLTTHSKTPNMILHLTTHSNTPNMNLAPYIPYDHTLEHLAHETDILHVSYILRDHSFTTPWYNSWAKAIHQKTSPVEKYRHLFEKYCCKSSPPHPPPLPRVMSRVVGCVTLVNESWHGYERVKSWFCFCFCCAE